MCDNKMTERSDKCITITYCKSAKNNTVCSIYMYTTASLYRTTSPRTVKNGLIPTLDLHVVHVTVGHSTHEDDVCNITDPSTLELDNYPQLNVTDLLSRSYRYLACRSQLSASLTPLLFTLTLFHRPRAPRGNKNNANARRLGVAVFRSHACCR